MFNPHELQLEEFDEAMNHFVNRRFFLCANTPDCPNCGEDTQIQLFNHVNEPALWRCRHCKHVYEFEPKIVE